MSSIPPVVPQTLRNEAIRVQNQLKILIHNYKILSSRLDKDPEDKRLIAQVAQVQDYIVAYNQEQCFLLEKIRQFLKDLEAGKFFRQETLASSTSSSPNSKHSPNSLSDDDRETIDDEGSDDHECSDDEQKIDPYTQYFTDENLYTGHVEQYDVQCESCLDCETKFSSPTKKLKQRDEIFNQNTDQNKYMKNLELLSKEVSPEFESVLQSQRENNKYSQFVYIPEVSDRKYRNQSFLVKLAVSPPQLRKRKQEMAEKSNRPTRAVTFPPVRMGTRKQSSMKQQRMEEEKQEIEKLFKSDVE